MARVPWRTRYRTSKAIFAQAFRLLGKERDLWLFPALGGLGMLALIAVVAVLIVPFSGAVLTLGPWLPAVMFIAALPLVILFGVVMTLLQAAFVYALHGRLEGRAVTRGQAWRAALRQLGPIVRFSIVAALVAGAFQVVGVLLDKLRLVPFLGRITQTVGGFAWAAATFFVIPVLVVERERSATQAVKESVAIGRAQWGKAVAGIITIGLAAMVPLLLVMVPVLAAMPILTRAGAPIWLAIGLPFGFLFLAMSATMVVTTAAQGAYQTALFRYARTGEVSAPFSAATLVDAWEPYR